MIMKGDGDIKACSKQSTQNSWQITAMKDKHDAICRVAGYLPVSMIDCSFQACAPHLETWQMMQRFSKNRQLWDKVQIVPHGTNYKSMKALKYYEVPDDCANGVPHALKQTFRSICGGRFEDQIHRIPVWRSTFVERWTMMPRWILRSTLSIYAQEEQRS